MILVGVGGRVQGRGWDGVVLVFAAASRTLGLHLLDCFRS